jgi:hypothetical protein
MNDAVSNLLGGLMANEEGGLMNKAEEAAQDLRTRFSSATSTARTRTGELATQTATRAREVTSGIGHQMRQFGGKLRDRTPYENMRGTTNRVADTLESAGSYLEEKNIEGMLEDVTSVIRRYPLQALLAGIALGFLLAKKRRSEY